MEAKPYLKELVLQREMVSSFNDYPFNIPAIANLSSLKFHPDVTFIVGENGSGKSTLVEAIALSLGFSTEGGTKNSQFHTNQNSSNLYQYLKAIKSFRKPSDYFFLRAESFYNVASYMEEVHKENIKNLEKFKKQYGVDSLHKVSHGESFIALITHRLGGRGLYIFDEPEAALSPSRQLVALSSIHKLVNQHSQFIIATHSPILLSYPNAVIYQLDDTGIREVKYEETEHYMVTKHFLSNHKEMLEILMQE